MKNIVGFGVNIKPQFRNQLDGDPNSGVIVEQFSANKVKVFWCNGTTSSHDKNSPYMQRFELKEVLWGIMEYTLVDNGVKVTLHDETGEG